MVIIDRQSCIGCNRCVQDCVARNLRLQENKAQVLGECFLCGHCVAICPTNALSIPDLEMSDVEELRPNEAALDADHLLKAIKFRRSIRNFKNTPVTRDDFAQLLQAGRYTPTAKNSQHCRFILVQEQLDSFKELVWEGIGGLLRASNGAEAGAEAYRDLYNAKCADRKQDYLFRNAPAVLLITADAALDAGMAIQSMELMGTALGIGFLHNGYLRRAIGMLPQARQWLSTENTVVEACALIGYPAVSYRRTAPRRPAEVRFL